MPVLVLIQQCIVGLLSSLTIHQIGHPVLSCPLWQHFLCTYQIDALDYQQKWREKNDERRMKVCWKCHLQQIQKCCFVLQNQMHFRSCGKCSRQMIRPEAGGKASLLPGCTDPISWCEGCFSQSTSQETGQLGNRKFTDTRPACITPLKPDHSQLSSVVSAHETLVSRKQKHCTQISLSHIQLAILSCHLLNKCCS